MPKKTELDKLDIDKIIEEIKEEDVKEEPSEGEEEEKEEKKEEKKEEPEKKKDKKKIIFFAVWGICGISTLFLGFLTFKEATKKVLVKSPYIKINPEVIYLSPEKKEKALKEKALNTYNFNLSVAYEFNGINEKKILNCQVSFVFKTHYTVDLGRLYDYIKSNIYLRFKKLTKDRFIEEIPDYNTKISLIIEEEIVKAITSFCKDIDKKKIEKVMNFVIFVIK